MADKAMSTYLNDHLAGATAGADLAEQIRDRHQGTPLGDVMTPLAADVESDRKALMELMNRIGAQPNPVKQATGWVAEKVSRVKFSGALSGNPDQGAFMALESLALGVEGKASLWRSLKMVADKYPALATTNLDELLERAEAQKAILDREQLTLGEKVLTPEPPPERVNPYSADRPPAQPALH